MGKNKWSEKKVLLYSGLLIIVLGLFVYFTMTSQVQSLFGSDTLGEFCVESSEGTGDLACVTLKEAGGFQPLLIQTPDVTPEPGKPMSVALGFQVPEFDSIYSARFVITKDSGSLVDSFDFKDELIAVFAASGVCNQAFGQPPCSIGGGSDVQSLNFELGLGFTAPRESGTYRLQYIVKQDDGQTMATEFIEISVGTTECPTGFCDEWFTNQEIDNGVWQQRSCYEFTDAPACQQLPDTQYRTKCNSGYHIQGQSGRTDNGYHNCLADQQDEEDTPPPPPPPPPEDEDEPEQPDVPEQPETPEQPATPDTPEQNMSGTDGQNSTGGDNGAGGNDASVIKQYIDFENKPFQSGGIIVGLLIIIGGLVYAFMPNGKKKIKFKK